MFENMERYLQKNEWKTPNVTLLTTVICLIFTNIMFAGNTANEDKPIKYFVQLNRAIELDFSDGKLNCIDGKTVEVEIPNENITWNKVYTDFYYDSEELNAYALGSNKTELPKLVNAYYISIKDSEVVKSFFKAVKSLDILDSYVEVPKFKRISSIVEYTEDIEQLWNNADAKGEKIKYATTANKRLDKYLPKAQHVTLDNRIDLPTKILQAAGKLDYGDFLLIDHELENGQSATNYQATLNAILYAAAQGINVVIPNSKASSSRGIDEYTERLNLPPPSAVWYANNWDKAVAKTIELALLQSSYKKYSGSPFSFETLQKQITNSGESIQRAINETLQASYRIAPINDSPCSATPVPVAQSCVWFGDDNTGATQTTSLAIPACDAPGNNDLWYKFVVPPSGYISFQSRALTLERADLGLGIYTGGCANPIYYFCDKNSLPNPDSLVQYMPSFTRLNLRAYIGQEVLLRLWEFGNGAHFGTYEFCIVEEILPATNCDDTYLEILETVNISTPVQLGEDNLVTGQQKYIEWTVVANQDIPEGAVALYNGNIEIHKQAISVNAGEQFCVCPIISEVESAGSESGTTYTFRLVINPNSNDLNNVNAGSQLVCEENVFFYTPQITVDPLRDFIYDNGDEIKFYVNKNIQEPVKLEVENTVTGASVEVNDALDFAEVIYFTELGYCVQDWIIPASLPEGSYELVATSTVDGSIAGRGAAFIVGGCIDPFISQFEEETVFATEYLCFNNLIEENLDYNEVTTGQISLGEAAILAYNALHYLTPNIPEYPTKDFPIPIINLQSETSENADYYTAARTLSYLHYDDGEPALPRNWFYFDEDQTVTRALALRMIMETFDVMLPPDFFPAPYSDVPENHLYNLWLSHGNTIGIANNESNFRPDDPITYEEFYIMLFRTMSGFNTLDYIAYPDPKEEDFYTPGNYSPEAMPYHLGITDGIFNMTGGSPIVIPGKGLPLSFSFFYSSVQNDLPLEFYQDVFNGQGYDFNILGKGWSHNYNARVIKTGEGEFERYVFVWPNNQVFSYNNATESFDSPSVFDDVTINGNQIVYKTKSQVVYTFDKANGNNYYVLKEVRDRYNNKLELEYRTDINGHQCLDLIKDGRANTRFIDFVCRGDNKLESVTESVLDRSVSFGVLGDRLRTYTDLIGNSYSFNYNPSGDQWQYLLTESIYPKLNNTFYTYLNNKIMFLEMGRSGNSFDWQTHYDENNSEKFTSCKVTSPTSISTDYSKDEKGRITSVTSPTDDLEMNSFGTGNMAMLPLSWSHNSIDYTATYDNNGNQEVSKMSSGGESIETKSTWNIITNNLETYEDALNNVYTYHYDSNDGLQQVVFPDNSTYTIERRNDCGQVEKLTSQENVSIEIFYNPDGYVNRVLNNNLGISSETIPDEIGRISGIVDPLGNTTTIDFLGNSLVDYSIDPAGCALINKYDENNNLIEIKNQKQEINNLSYTDEEDWISRDEFGPTFFEIDYYDDGLPKSVRKGNLSGDFKFDAVTRLIEKSPTGTYKYSNDGRFNVTQIKNTVHGVTLNLDYDVFNRMTDVECIMDGTSSYVSYDYDDSGNILKIYYGGRNSNKVVTYEYDELNRCKRIFDWKDDNTPIVAYSYLKDGRLDKEFNRNGTRTEYSYDEGGRLTKIETKSSIVSITGSNLICANSFDLDDAGYHTEETFWIPGQDVANPIITYSSTEYGPSPYNLTTNFVEDDNDSRIEYNQSGTTKSIEDLSFTYDFDDYLKTVKIGNITRASYRYDGMGHRRQKNLNFDPDYSDVSKIDYNLDVLGMGNVITESIELDNGQTREMDYIYSPFGMVARHFGNSTEFYHYDFRGSVLATTNQDKAITHSYSYSPDGLVTHEIGQQYDQEYPFWYTYVAKYGVQKDVEGLYYMRDRYMYEPMGRFLTPDPVWSSNLYLYANADPMHAIDPDGNFVNFLIGAVAGAAIDLAVQGILVATGAQDKVNWTSVAISAAAGATGVGISSVIAKSGASYAARKGLVFAAEIAAETALGLVEDAGKQYARGEEVKIGWKDVGSELVNVSIGTVVGSKIDIKQIDFFEEIHEEIQEEITENISSNFYRGVTHELNNRSFNEIPSAVYNFSSDVISNRTDIKEGIQSKKNNNKNDKKWYQFRK